mgnify:CR=1 FL=1
MEYLTLQICTPEGVCFDGKIISVTARTTVGDICIMNHHANYMTTIENGSIVIKTEDKEIRGVCGGGVLSVCDNAVRIIVNKFDIKT